MMKYLLDTNTCSHIMARTPPQVRERFEQHDIGEIGVSVITTCEMEYGIAHSSKPEKNRLALTEFLTLLEVVDFRREVAPVYGHVRAYLRRQGTPIGPLDILIASHALYLDLTVVTNNVREFERVPGLTARGRSRLIA